MGGEESVSPGWRQRREVNKPDLHPPALKSTRATGSRIYHFKKVVLQTGNKVGFLTGRDGTESLRAASSQKAWDECGPDWKMSHYSKINQEKMDKKEEERGVEKLLQFR